MSNSKFCKFSILGLLPVIMTVGVAFSFNKISKNQSVCAEVLYPHEDYYHNNTLPTTIDLNDADATTIRNYYANLNGKNLNGDNLLAALKPILSNGQLYFSYESNDAIWTAYEITDRDWKKSPATEITGEKGSYNPTTGIITNYVYGSNGMAYNDSKNPYIHALYVDRTFDNPMKAWSKNLGGGIYGDNPQGFYAHAQRWGGFNQEHIWAKAHGFDNEGKGGARGDLMHLWPGDGRANLMHNDNCYGYVDKNAPDSKHVVFYDQNNNLMPDNLNYAINNWLGTSVTVPVNAGDGKPNTVFEPQDSDKGDIARACFYMCARYNHIADNDPISADEPWLTLSDDLDPAEPRSYTSTKDHKGVMGVMSDLLEWNRIDPVDEFEIHRNNILANSFTKNRNPFIDFPQWADIIWGDGKDGETYANPATDIINNNDGATDVVVTSIDVDSSACKKTFRNGDPFTSDGLVVTAHYSDKSSKVVTGRSKVTKVNTNIGGTYNVEVSFGGCSGSYTIDVFHEKIMLGKTSGLPVANVAPMQIGDLKLTMSNGTNERYAPRFDGTNVLVYNHNLITFECLHKIKQIDVRFMSDDKNIITIEAGSGTYSESSATGENIGTWLGSSKKVTLMPGGTSGKRLIRQIDVLYDDGYQLTGLEVNPDTLNYQKVYGLEHFDVDAGEEQQTKLLVSNIDAKALYKDGTSKTIQFEDFSVNGFETDSIGPKNVTLVYGENGIKKEYSLPDIKVRDFENMTISASVIENSKFYYGKAFNKSLLNVTAIFGLNDTEPIDSEAVTISNYNKNALGSQTIKVTYGGKSTTVTITVIDYLSSIEVIDYKYDEYVIGAKFEPELDGVVIVAHYAGPTPDITLNVDDCTFSELDTSIVGAQTITVSYQGLQTSFDVTIVEPEFDLLSCFGSMTGSIAIVSITSLLGAFLLLLKRKEQ